MKKIILGVLIVFSLIGCSRDYLIDQGIYGLLEPVEFYDFAEYDLSNIHSFTDIGAFLRRNVAYRKDTSEEFSSPETTMERGYGDCDDFAIAFMSIAYIVFGIKMELLLVLFEDGVFVSGSRTVVEGGDGDHMVVRYADRIYSGQWGLEMNYTHVRYKYTFDEVFY